MTTGTDAPTPVVIGQRGAPPGENTPPRRRRTGPLRTFLGLLAAWLLPVGLDQLRLDWLLPLAILVVLASLLRGGRTLTDRLVLALALLLGATCVAGLLFSYWPWGLAPVPVAGGALTGLVLLAALLRRRPSLPLRVPAADGVVLALTALAGLSVFWPYFRRDATGRFGLVAAGGDLASHFSIVDTMRQIGGYVFLHQAQADSSVWYVYRTYPQGAHLTGALLMGFLRGSGTRGTALSELYTFIWLEPASFVMLCLAVLWAARRLAGPGVRVLAFAPAAGLAIAYLVWSDPIMVLWMGFWPEILALAELAILLAILARPLHRTREQVMVVTALLVAMVYTYFLMLPIAAVVVLLWLVWSRRRLWRHRWYVLAVGLSGAAAGSVMLVVNLRGYSAANHLLAGGAVVFPNNRQLLALGLLAGIGGLARGGWRSRAYRSAGVAVVLSVVFAAGVAAYQVRRLGVLDYFYYKSTHIAMVAFLVALGPAARVLNRAILPRTRLVSTATGLALTLAALAALGPVGDASFGRLYLEGKYAWDWPAQAATEVVRHVSAQTGTITVVWAGRSFPAQASHWSGVLLRDEGVSWRAQVWAVAQPLVRLPPPSAIERLARESAPIPVRFVSDNPGLLRELRAIRTAHPDWRLEIVDLPLPRVRH